MYPTRVELTHQELEFSMVQIGRDRGHADRPEGLFAAPVCWDPACQDSSPGPSVVKAEDRCWNGSWRATLSGWSYQGHGTRTFPSEDRFDSAKDNHQCEKDLVGHQTGAMGNAVLIEVEVSIMSTDYGSEPP